MRPIATLLMLTALAGAQSHDKRVAPVEPGARQSFERQRKVAVLVGVGAYPEGSGLATLKYPARDVAELAAELEKQGYAVRQLIEGQASAPGSGAAGEQTNASHASERHSPRQRNPMWGVRTATAATRPNPPIPGGGGVPRTETRTSCGV
jgi:hypothetical protein